MLRPGIEPGFIACKAGILTTSVQKHIEVRLCLCYTRYTIDRFFKTRFLQIGAPYWNTVRVIFINKTNYMTYPVTIFEIVSGFRDQPFLWFSYGSKKSKKKSQKSRKNNLKSGYHFQLVLIKNSIFLVPCTYTLKHTGLHSLVPS